jgi:hypothetical protein
MASPAIQRARISISWPPPQGAVGAMTLLVLSMRIPHTYRNARPPQALEHSVCMVGMTDKQRFDAIFIV